MKTIFSLRSTLIVLAIALGSAVIAATLPDNPYQRWQLLDDTIHKNARWIYERVHFDPAPIDVAFVGPSRMGAGIDAPHLQQALARRGVEANVVNFSMPENGRDMHYAIVEEMFRAKRPKLIVIGVIEKPSRYGHSAFKYIARPGLVADPGYFGNINWASNLIYLPFRQLELFTARFLPGAMDLTATFDPSGYRGRSVDSTGDILLPDGTLKNGTQPASREELERGVKKLESGLTPPLLPASLADWEFGDERHYIRRIVEAAKAHGTDVAFLFLPYYTGPSKLQEQAFYDQYGPVWNAGFVASHAEWFADYAHVTADAADKISDWTAEKVAAYLRGDETKAGNNKP